MRTFKEKKAQQLEQNIREALNTPEIANEDELFVFADYDPSSGEKTGYSNYSYWGCTFRAFLKRRMALFLLIVLILLLAFTMIQPYLPGQYKATKINNYPMSEKQLKNVQPTLDNIRITLPAGTPLQYSEFTLDGQEAPDAEWVAVSGQIARIPGRSGQKTTPFTLLEYGEEWSYAEYNGIRGYVKTADLSIKPEKKRYDLVEYEGRYNTPYEVFSNSPTIVYASETEFSNPDPNADGWLYTERKYLEFGENGICTTVTETPLRIYPSTYGFLFGTNEIGQDLWARVWTGTRTSLFIGFMVAIVEAFVGIMVGVLWGYVRQLDRLLTEVYNVLDNIPTTIILILIAYVMSPSVTTIIFAMCLTRWMGMARFIRNQIIIIRDRDYNIASRCLGSTAGQIMMKNLLPYLVSVIMLRMALSIPGAIGNEVFITYIGLGIPVDTPSLGNLINVGRKLFASASSLGYQLLFPTIVLSVITISFYVIGNAFADAADPRNHL